MKDEYACHYCEAPLPRQRINAHDKPRAPEKEEQAIDCTHCGTTNTVIWKRSKTYYFYKIKEKK